MKRSPFPFDDELDEFFKDTVYFVEANSFESLAHWREFHERLKWKQHSMGHGLTIGTIDNRPIVVSVNYNWFLGKKVVFYDPCSQLVDHKMVDEFIEELVNRYEVPKENGRFPQCNSSNFHHCIHRVEDLAKKEVSSEA